MKRCKLTVLTGDGNLEISAYNIGNGIYVHKFINKDGKPSTRYWTISTKCGYSLIHFRRKPINSNRSNRPHLLKEVVAEAQKLTELDWTFTAEEWKTMDQSPYQKLVYKEK